MHVKCYELMNIPTFKNIELVAGESGLNRLVSWVYILTTPSLNGWVRGGELIFIVNSEEIENVLRDAVLNEVAGVVLLKSEYNQSFITEKISDFANKENLPLFEMDYNVKILDVTRDISAYIMQRQKTIDYLDRFFYNVLFSENLDKKKIDDFTLHYGFTNEHIFFISTIHSKDISKLNEIHDTIQRYLDDTKGRFLMMNLNSYLVILAYTTPDTVKKAKTLLKSSFSMLNEKFPEMLYLGIGNTCTSLYDIRNSYKKSMRSVDLCTAETRIIDCEELGFPRLLLNSEEEELEEYARYILGDVKDYEEKHQSSFLDTMEAYILCNGNISQAATQLYIHRNTCIYRIARINELFGIDLDDSYTRAEILNCLYIYRFLDEIK